MRLIVPALTFVALALAVAACGTFRVEAGFMPPAALTATAKAGPPSTANQASSSGPINTSAPGITKSPTPSSPFAQNVQSVGASQPASADADNDAAIQTILDYFDALNQGDYGRAYRYWSGEGESSLRSYDEFARGYANTIHAEVQIETVSAKGAGIARSRTVSVTIASIVNEPDHTQDVQRFQGTYTLQPSASTASNGNDWQIASANIAQVPSNGQKPADVADPVTLLQSYFAAINRREFALAYTYWSDLGRASQQTFTQFREGFAATNHVSVQMGEVRKTGAAGSAYADVPVVIVATQNDRTTQTFCGTYTLRSTQVPPFDQLGWRIEGARTRAANNVRPESAEAHSLLASCGR